MPEDTRFTYVFNSNFAPAFDLDFEVAVCRSEGVGIAPSPNYVSPNSAAFVAPDKVGVVRRVNAPCPTTDTTTLTIPAGRTWVKLRANTFRNKNAEALERTGWLRMTVVDSRAGSYKVPGTDSAWDQSFKVDIVKVTEVSIIARSETTIEEGEDAKFKLILSEAVPVELTVYLYMSQKGDFFVKNQRLKAVSISSGKLSKRFKERTIDDTEFEANGRITAELLPGPGYTVAPEPGNSVRIKVTDNDPVPLVSVQAVTESVAEGDKLWFLVSAEGDFKRKKTVAVSVRETAGNYLTADVPETVVIWPNYNSAYVKVNTVDDWIEEPDGEVVLSLVSGKGYEVNADANRAVAMVVDNDSSLPVVSVSTVSDTLEEGGIATFSISTNIAPSKEIAVNLDVRPDGNFILGEIPETVMHSDAESPFFLEIRTLDDNEDEPDGSITVEILDGEGYEVALVPQNIARVEVTDNDVKLEPALEIASIESSISEGETALFEISAQTRADADYFVNVKIEMGDSSEVRIVKMDEGVNSATVSVRTIDNQIFGLEKSMIATLVTGDGYRIDDFNNSATVKVLENEEVPTVSVEAIISQVTEGSPVWFLLKANRAWEFVQTVNVDVSESVGNYLKEEPLESVTFKSYHRVLILSLKTVDDGDFNGNGEISVTVKGGEGYVQHQTEGIASVVVLDNDHSVAEPEVSISSIYDSMQEGDTAVFRVSSSEPASTDITVLLSVDKFGEFISPGYSTAVLISKFNTIGLVLIRTEDDEIDEEDGWVTVSVLDGEGYSPAEGDVGSHRVDILDNDEPIQPTSISISEVSATIVEGGNAEFVLLSSRPVDARTTVRVSIDTVGEFFAKDIDGIMEVDLDEERTSVEFFKVSIDDMEEEEDGTITATILSDDNSPETYIVNGTFFSAIVNVSDDDNVTTVSVESVGSPIEESDTDPAEFIITSTNKLLNDLTINLDVRETGNVIKGTPPAVVTLEAGKTSVELEVPLSDDPTNEATSRITVAFEPGTGYTVAESPGNSAYVDVTDNDQFVLRAGMHMDGRRAPWDEYQGALPIEGLPMILYFNTEEPYGTEVNRDITINFEATDTQGKLISPPTSAVIKEGDARSGEVLLPTSCNEANEPSSTITVRVLPGDGYVSQGDGTFTATLNDIYIGSEGLNTCRGPRVISIAADQSEISEGESFNVTITPDGHNNGTYSVFVDIVNEVGNFVADTRRREIEFKDGSKQNKHLTITAQDNNDPEETGVIKVSIVDTEDSIAGPLGTVRVNVLNDDPERTAVRVVPMATISRVSGEIEEGGTAEFVIRLDSDAKSKLDVNVAWTVEGDYLNAGTRKVIVPKDGREGKLSLVTKGDPDIKLDGSVTAIIKPGEGYDIDLEDLDSISATITILDNDESPSPARSEALHRSVLPDLLAASSEQTVNAVSSRIDFAFNNAGQSRFELGGASSIEEMVKLSGQLMNEGDVNLTRILSGSSFALPMMQDGDAGSIATLWGSGFSRDVSNDVNESSVDWSGDSLSGLLGFDARIGSGFLAGMGASSNDSSVDFRQEDREGVLEGMYQVRMTSLQPYFGWSNDDHSTQLRASAGYGLGEVVIDYGNYDPEVAESRQHSMLLGGTERLYSSKNLLGGSSELTLNAEAWTARQFVEDNDGSILRTSVDTRSLRLTAEGTLDRQLESGSIFNPKLSIGTRWDGGDDRQGFGLEFAGGAGFENSFGLSISGSGRMLLTDSASSNERGVIGKLTYDYGTDGIGLFSNFSPALGVLEGSGIKQLWDGDVVGSDSLRNSDGVRLESEIGYGIGILNKGLILTPYASTELNEGGRNVYGVGSLLTTDSNISLKIEGFYDSTLNGTAERKYILEGGLEW